MALGRTVTNPVTGEQIPMYVADYVLMEYGTGAIMAVPAHDERDHAFAEKFGLEIRRVVDCGDLPCAGEGPLVNSGDFTGMPASEGKRAIIDWLEARGDRQRVDQLPAARLAAVAPALLGLPDPGRLLRGARHRAGAGRPAAGRAARRRGLRAQGQVAAGGRRGLGQHDLPGLRQAGPARDRHDGHVRRLVLVLPALLRPAQRPGALRPRGRRLLDAGRPVHRRRRARDPAPDVRALLRQGARGHGLPGRAGAVRAAVHAGDDPARRRQDVQVEGQRRLAAGRRRPLRGRHRARLHPVPRPAEPGRGLVRGGRRRRAPLPVAALDGGGARRPTAPPSRTASPPTCCARRTGRSTRSRATCRTASPSTRRSRR